MKCDPAKRYNARGERLCVTCLRYLATDQFHPERRMRDGLRSSCKTCVNAATRRHNRRRFADDAVWQRTLERKYAARARLVAERREEQRLFAQTAVNALRDKGFTLKELRDLTGIERSTLSYYSTGKFPRYFKRGPLEALQRAMLATADLPRCGRPKRRGHRKPHPALGLVRARLARMAYLAALEAAA